MGIHACTVYYSSYNIQPGYEPNAMINTAVKKTPTLLSRLIHSVSCEYHASVRKGNVASYATLTLTIAKRNLHTYQKCLKIFLSKQMRHACNR